MNLRKEVTCSCTGYGGRFAGGLVQGEAQCKLEISVGHDTYCDM